MLLRPAPSRNTVSAPETVIDYVDWFPSFLDPRKLASMLQDGGKLDFVDVCLGTRLDAALGRPGSAGKRLKVMAVRY